jgi:FKBP-type peptidyl-prolyl cis-trans isomerase
MRSLVFSLLVTLTAAPLASAQSLGIEVTKPVDCVRKTQNGDKISVNYRGTLKSDGSEFDSSYRRNTPFKFSLGKGQVIAGWDQGLLDMCIGEGRKLTIPPNLGYGQSRSGPIPPGSTLSKLEMYTRIHVENVADGR